MIDWELVITPEDKFQTAKQAKFAEIATKRWEEETAPYLYAPKEAHFDTSERSQIKYLQALQKGMTVMWKTSDGWVEMTQPDFAGLIASYEAFVAELFLKEATLVAQVQEVQTPEELEAIVW